jgi:sulfite reductase beta subunit-like hemoprotein
MAYVFTAVMAYVRVSASQAYVFAAVMDDVRVSAAQACVFAAVMDDVRAKRWRVLARRMVRRRSAAADGETASVSGVSYLTCAVSAAATKTAASSAIRAT